MQTPNFGEMLLDAVKTDVAMVWSNWPAWSHEHPIIWLIAAVMGIGVLAERTTSEMSRLYRPCDDVMCEAQR